MAEKNSLTEADLAQFTGSEQLYRHSLVKRFCYTDGVKYIAERAGAYWLIDEIAFAQVNEVNLAMEGFQLWVLSVNADKSAMLTCDDGNGHTLHQQAIEYTDFPLAEIKFYVCDDIILLPSEY